jgi:hypothetical protein
MADVAAQRGGIGVRDYTASGALAGQRAGAQGLGRRLARMTPTEPRAGWVG